MSKRVAMLIATVVGVVAPLATPAASAAPVVGAGSYIVTLRSGTDPFRVILDHGLNPDAFSSFMPLLDGFGGYLSADQATAVSGDPRVVGFEHDQILSTDGTQTTFPVGLSSPNVTIPWGLDRIDQRGSTLSGTYAPLGSASSVNGSGVRVFVVDSGVNGTHNEFTSRLASGFSYLNTTQTSGVTQTTVTNWYNSLASGTSGCTQAKETAAGRTHPYNVDTMDGTASTTDVGSPDNDGHGTHVSGIAAGTNTGVAKGATIVPVRVLNSCGSGTASMVLNGLNWISSHHTTGQRDVVNMSIGFDSSSSSINTAITALLNANVTVVAAAGNAGATSCTTTPAATPGTISVGALGQYPSGAIDTEASYSNYGDCVDIFAPGTSIVSSWNTGNNQYASDSGTSMAAPHVTGAVALYLQNAADLSPAAAWNWLKGNATYCAATLVHSAPTAGVDSGVSPNRMLYVGDPTVHAAPCAPSTPAATTANASSVVSWTAPYSDNGSAVIDYTATASPGGVSCTTAGLSCTLAGLNNGQTYTISVTARSAVGAGQAATVSVTPVGLPSAPTNFVATPGNTQVTLSWDSMGNGMTYNVVASPDGASCSTTSTSCVVTGLTNLVTYTFTVTATNVSGAGPSSTATATPDAPAPAPTAVTILPGNASMTVSWAGLTTYAAGSVKYTVTASPGGASCTTTGTSCVIAGLTNGVNYKFSITTATVTSSSGSGVSAFSAQVGVRVLVTSVKKGSKTALTKIISVASSGTKKWSVTPSTCKISGGYLLAPKKAGTCTVKLTVAKTAKNPAYTSTAKLKVL